MMGNRAERMERVVAGFELESLVISLSDILPTRTLSKYLKESHKFEQIAASIREIGLVEPPVVARLSGDAARFLLLDGHVRLEILKSMGVGEVECLVSTDDEAFTYNRRISRLASAQEHKMILKAIERGVPEERIAKALAINVASVKRKARLLDGICSEAEALLKDKPCPMVVFEILKRMRPLRQIEAAELMVNANNYSRGYAAAILAGTPQAQLVEADRPKKMKGMTPAALARMERELARLHEQVASVQDAYGKDHLELTVAKGYLAKLLNNGRIVRHMMQRWPDILGEFQNIAELTSTMPSEAA